MKKNKPKYLSIYRSLLAESEKAFFPDIMMAPGNKKVNAALMIITFTWEDDTKMCAGWVAIQWYWDKHLFN